MKKFPLSLALLLTLSTLPSAKADLLSLWTFETALSTNNIIGSGLASAKTQSGVGADIGSGTASASHAATATWSIPVGNGSAHSWSANTWGVGDYFQFQVGTLNFTGISVSFDQTGSATGPSQFTLQYSTDGSTFTAFGSPYTLLVNAAPNFTWNGTTATNGYNFSFDLSSITALNNTAAAYFRIVDNSTVSLNGGTVATAGTDRLDNVMVNGTSTVPEPTSLAVLGMGVLGLRLLRRKY